MDFFVRHNVGVIMKQIVALSSIFCVLLLSEAISANLEKGIQAGKAGDFKTALEEYVPLAKSGVAEAQYRLGSMYAVGLGLPQNAEEAVRWYTLAANQEHPLAQYFLGGIYYKGRGSVEEDGAIAIVFFSRAAENRLPKAQVQLGAHYLTGKFVPKDYIESYKWTMLGTAGAQDIDDKGTYDRGNKILDLLGKKMTQEQKDEGFRRAMIVVEKNDEAKAK